ncbi:MAG: WG repeat-containing protein [Bacteroidales bacterium]|nr:WG repeat-containing protein [Bacteroidales bacterium]
MWIAKPIEGDSLVCYSDGVHRGFFHMADGRVVVPPIYNHAWVFSEGLAAVELDGRLRFIDTAGRTVIDKLFAYNSSANGYVFHKGHCAVHDSTGKLMGLIDRTGQWVLPPVYQNIFSYDTFWVINNDREQSVLTFGLDTVLPFTRASFEIGDTSITATFADHTQSTYTLQGKLIVAAQIRDVGQMTYNTREVFYCKSGDFNECTEEYEYDTHAETRTAVASCLRYEAEDDWYGLMAPDGRIITPPIYRSIEAVDKDLYLCKTSYGRGVLLNSKGIRVK